MFLAAAGPNVVIDLLMSAVMTASTKLVLQIGALMPATALKANPPRGCCQPTRRA